MNEIEVARDWREVDVAAIQRKLNSRFHGRWAWFLVGFASVFVAVLGLVLIGTVSPTLGPGTNGAFAVFIGVFAFILLAQRLQRKLMRAMFDVPARREPSVITLNAEGIAAPGALIAGRMPWRWVTEIVDWHDALLVLISPVEFIPLADSGLPAGMTREKLKAPIETWRETAQ